MLPGQPLVWFQQFSGYVTVDDKKQKSLFYYFVEAEVDPVSKPLVLWLNGGPGCSSLGVGAFSENEPFRPNGQVLVRNEYSWNKEANMLYLETPVGVGFSYSTDSSSYEAVNDEVTGVPCKIRYGSGSIYGFFSQDNVRVGDVVIKDQVFSEATREGLKFLLAQFDGILGLGFQDMAVGKVKPVWYNMVQQGLVTQQVFSIWLNRNPKSEVGGEIVFGGVDWRHFSGDHTFVPIAQSGYWQIEVGDILIASNSTGFCGDGCAAIVDSGSSFIGGPTAMIAQINHVIGAEGVVSLECKKVVSKYGDLIWELLISGLQPRKVCVDIGLCLYNQSSAAIETMVDITNSQGLPDDGSALCNFCEMTVFWLQVEFQKNRAKEKVFRYVNEMCERLPNPRRESFINCDNIANMPYVSFLIEIKS